MVNRLTAGWLAVVAVVGVGCAAAAPRPVPPAVREPPAAAFQPPIAPAATGATTGFADVNVDSSLISNGSVTASSDKLLSTAAAFRREVYRLGGRVYSEQIHFRDHRGDGDRDTAGDGGDASLATYRIKLLPRLLPDLLDWLGGHAAITAQDVSSIIALASEADASIVRGDVQQRLAEITAQLADPDLDPPHRAALEREQRELTGAAIADPRALADNTQRVAVLDVRLEAPERPDGYAHGTRLGHARGSLLDPGIGRGSRASRASRVGGGIAIGGRSPVSSFELLYYAASAMDERAAVTATVGFGSYARALGGGHRGAFNLYVGARLGYAYLGGHYAAVAAELGLELVKQRGVLWTVSARPMGLLGADSMAAVELGSSIGLAF
jgi:hypothetical protein